MQKKMKMILYRRHDIDLITIYKSSKLNFLQALKSSLLAAAEGRKYTFKVPPIEDSVYNKDYKFKYQIFIKLDDNNPNDAKIIYWLKNVKDGYRNALFRTVLRNSIVGSFYFACMQNDNARIEQNKVIEIMTGNYDNASIRKKYLDKKKNTTVQSSKSVKMPITNKMTSINIQDSTNNFTDTKNAKNVVDETSSEYKNNVMASAEPVITEDKNSEEDDFDFFGSMQQLLNDKVK